MCCRWFGGYGGFGGMGMLLGILFILALVAGGVLLIIWLSRRSGSSEFRSSHFAATSSALDIAKERYAKGEISREEYQTLISELERR